MPVQTSRRIFIHSAWTRVQCNFGLGLFCCSNVLFTAHNWAKNPKFKCILWSLSLCPQGEFPWDNKDFWSLAVMGAGLASGFLYFYWRDPGREINWKHLVRYYLARGVVRLSPFLFVLLPGIRAGIKSTLWPEGMGRMSRVGISFWYWPGIPCGLHHYGFLFTRERPSRTNVLFPSLC